MHRVTAEESMEVEQTLKEGGKIMRQKDTKKEKEKESGEKNGGERKRKN